jgi:two-component system, NtrC family, sensor kinase
MHPDLMRELEALGLDPDVCPDRRWVTLLVRLNAHFQRAERERLLRERLERELLESQKMAALGRLTAGIAHDINTPIQFVGDNVGFLGAAIGDLLELCAGYQDLCRCARERPLDERDLAALHKAEEAADLDYIRAAMPRAVAACQDGVGRVSKIVLAMKNFAHPGLERKALADINAALAGTLVLAASEIKYVATVETDFAELPLVPCFIGDINQVVLNLLVNAAHSVAEANADGGALGLVRLSTRCHDDQVEIAISDSGCGIPVPIQARIFDLFFTTKAPGKGTGQGLAMARSVVVDKHGGTLTFKTDPGVGTTFFIRLPVKELASEADSAHG